MGTLIEDEECEVSSVYAHRSQQMTGQQLDSSSKTQEQHKFQMAAAQPQIEQDQFLNSVNVTIT